jgi:hypothetical protein
MGSRISILISSIDIKPAPAGFPRPQDRQLILTVAQKQADESFLLPFFKKEVLFFCEPPCASAPDVKNQEISAP